MQIRELTKSRQDTFQIRNFTCSTRTDPDYAHRIQKLVRTEVLPAWNDPQRDVQVLVADHGKDIVGVLAIEDRGDEWEIALLAVKTGYQRQGIASSLLDHALSNSGIRSTDLLIFTVHAHNHEMRSLMQGVAESAGQVQSDARYEIFLADPSELAQRVALKAERAVAIEPPQPPAISFGM